MLSLVSWNVNGFRSIHGKGLPEYLVKEAPDLLCLQETKVHYEQLSEAQRDFQSHTLDLNPAKRRGYSGVALLRNVNTPAPKNISYGLGESAFDDEGRYHISTFQDFTLYNIYFPSGSSGDERQEFKYRFLDHLLEHFSQLPEKERERSIVCGDFNICHRDIDIHHPKVARQRELSGFLPEECAWMDRFTALGFCDSFRAVHGEEKQQFSWWSYRANARAKNLGWRIDYIFVGAALSKSIISADIQESVPGSDHCPVRVNLALNA